MRSGADVQGEPTSTSEERAPAVGAGERQAGDLLRSQGGFCGRGVICSEICSTVCFAGG